MLPLIDLYLHSRLKVSGSFELHVTQINFSVIHACNLHTCLPTEYTLEAQ
jgi:hypothetical protein